MSSAGAVLGIVTDLQRFLDPAGVLVGSAEQVISKLSAWYWPEPVIGPPDGVRYAVVQAYNYNARLMHTVKDCVFGLMEREHAVAGEVFVPRTISNCTALANEGTAVIVCAVDLEAGEYVWADLESDRVMATLENAASRTAEALRAFLHNTRTSVYDLLLLHAQARGTVACDASADLAVRWEDLVTEYARVAAYTDF